ncbi:MAG: KamA family radical SAM protein, partial [Acidobacteriota bacterium]
MITRTVEAKNRSRSGDGAGPRGAISGARSASGPAPWQRLLRGAVRSLDELLDAVDLTAADLEDAGHGVDPAAAASFALRVPRGFVDRMRRGDPRDPLLLQVLPTARELVAVPGWVAEPLEESDFSPVDGLLHKYSGRALLVVTGACAVHCRYCFRRHFPYGEHVADLGPALEQLRADPTIREVLLSGGDPLSLSDKKLAQLVAELEAIPHVERLRIHTRLPAVLPERVDGALIGWLSRSRLQKVVVLHVNHPREV